MGISPRGLQRQGSAPGRPWSRIYNAPCVLFYQGEHQKQNTVHSSNFTGQPHFFIQAGSRYGPFKAHPEAIERAIVAIAKPGNLIEKSSERERDPVEKR